MSLNAPGPAAPDHVPADLVRPYAFAFGATSEVEPYSTFIPPIHEGPPIFYTLDAYPGPSPAWVIRKTADMRRVYLDTEHFSNNGFSPFAMLIGESWGLVPAETDPPLHGLHRAFVNPIFTPKATDKIDQNIRDIARDYVLRFKNKGECEFMSEFAFEFPIKVFLGLMGLPLEKTKEFLKWEMGMLHGHSMEEVAAATRSVVDYLRQEIEVRRKTPTDDLISFGINGRIGDRPLTDDELMGFVFNLFIGGLDTVSAHMGLHFRHLAENVANQRILRENPAKIADGIEEMMRAFGGTTTFRTCIKETEVCGVTIKPGDKIAMATTLAGRDPEEFDQPNVVNFDRKPKHVSFAYGVHLCVGIHLARREMRIAMEEFLREIPEFTVAPGATITTLLSGVIQPSTLPLVWKV
jgi:cytochrome P450